MQISSLRSRIEKAGFTIEDTERKFDTAHRAVSGDCVVTWYQQDERVQCLHCGRTSQPGDSMTDYFPGFFPRTIKGAVEHLRKGATEEPRA